VRGSSSVRFRRWLVWLGLLAVVAAIVVVKKSANGSSRSTSSAKSASGSILSQDQFEKEMEQDEPNINTDRKWEQIPASARVAVRRFVIDGAGERNLARAWKYTNSELRGGLTYNQWLHGSQLPFTPFTQMNLKLPLVFTLTEWSAHDFLAEVGIASTDKRSHGLYKFNVGATKAGKGAYARWLVNYWMPLEKIPLRADPTQNFGG
jgi:hypothetical protein